MSPSVSKPEQEVQDRLCLITQEIPGRSLSWATPDELKHEGKALIFMIGTLSCHGLNVKCPGIQHRCLNMSSPGGMGILEGSRTFGKTWVTKASSLLPKICVCVLFLPPASLSWQPQTGKACCFTSLPTQDALLSHTMNQNAPIFFKWLLASSFRPFIHLCCLISSHQILVPPFTTGHHSWNSKIP